MTRTQLFRPVVLLVSIVALMLAGTGSASAASVTPTFYAGNPNCAGIDQDYGATWLELKVDPPSSGTYTSSDGLVRVKVTRVSDTTFNWESVAAADGVVRSIDAVIAKGGPDGNAYVYDPPAESFGDTGLHSPPSGGQAVAGLSHISFCYDIEQRISGVKFEDTNANGQQDAGEVPIPNTTASFTFYLDTIANGQYDAGEPTATTNAQGAYSFDVAAGTYTVREMTTNGWVCSSPAINCSYTRTIATGTSASGLNFGNYRPVKISGNKFRDETGNGLTADDTTAIGGVTIKLDPGTPNDATDDLSTTTAAGTGYYEFTNLRPGIAYRVFEPTPPTGFVCTTPAGNPCQRSWTAGQTGSGAQLTQNFANFEPKPHLRLVKTQSLTAGGTYVDAALDAPVGQVVYYQIVVTNTGNVPLSTTTLDPPLNQTGCDGPLQTAATGGTTVSMPRTLQPGAAETYYCTHTVVAGDGNSYTNHACVSGSSTTHGGQATALQGDALCDEVTVNIVKPAIRVVKSGTPATVHDGDAVVYSYDVSIPATGNTPLTNIGVSDDKCAPVTATTAAGFNVGDLNADNWLDLGEVWKYTCDYTADHADENADNEIVNTVTAVGTDKLGATVDDDDRWTTLVVHPDLALDKKERIAGESEYVNGPLTAQVGSTIEYQMTVTTGSGDTPMDVAGFSDDRCDAGTLTGPAGDTDGDGLLDTNEAWVYHCSHVLQASDPSPFVNVASVTASDTFGGDPITKSDKVDATVVPVTQPPPPRIQQPVQIVAGERIAPGTARLLGPTGCAANTFSAGVRGTKIASVVFKLDGKTIARLTKPSARNLFQVRINPRKLRVGVHRLVATIRFDAGSNTRPRTLRLSFQRCARKLRTPRFTG